MPSVNLNVQTTIVMTVGSPLIDIMAEIFDTYASNYDAALDQGLAVSGESKEYFAERRLVWLRDCLRQSQFQPTSVLDFGCGTGTSTPMFFDLLRVDKVVGVDLSSRSLEVARAKYSGLPAKFFLRNELVPSSSLDMAFCNGVFHHIPPADRLDNVRFIVDCLRPNGYFAFWENNPWNPGTRMVMRAIPFDKDAIMLSAGSACRLLTAAGLTVIRVDFCFYFPRFLSRLRWLEPCLTKLPLGAQYMVLARRAEPT